MTDLSRFQYIIIKNQSMIHNSNPWSSYFQLLSENCKCYPVKKKIEITEMGAKVDLESLLNHTAIRIIKCLRTIVINKHLILVCKWGSDDASGLPRYK